jgi:Arm DNA-binding domain
MADKKLITDRYLRARPPAPPGQRVEVFDTRVPGFGIRISNTEDTDPARRGKAGKITFVLYARFSPSAAPTLRVIGTHGATTLEEARRIAAEWHSQIDKGIDPAVVEAEAGEKETRERALRIKHSFATVAEASITDKLAQERRGKRAGHDLRAVFIAAWAHRPVSEITKLDVLEIINA